MSLRIDRLNKSEAVKRAVREPEGERHLPYHYRKTLEYPFVRKASYVSEELGLGLCADFKG